MGGFTNWVEQVADSKDAVQYRQKVSDAESASMWQSLSFGANYKAAYCMAVCPAGEDIIAPFLTERKQYLENVVRPFQRKEEIVYVVPGSDAEAHVSRRFPHKTAKKSAAAFGLTRSSDSLMVYGWFSRGIRRTVWMPLTTSPSQGMRSARRRS